MTTMKTVALVIGIALLGGAAQRAKADDRLDWCRAELAAKQTTKALDVAKVERALDGAREISTCAAVAQKALLKNLKHLGQSEDAARELAAYRRAYAQFGTPELNAAADRLAAMIDANAPRLVDNR